MNSLMTDLQGSKYYRLGTHHERIVPDCQLVRCELSAFFCIRRNARWALVLEDLATYICCGRGNNRNPLPYTSQPRRFNVEAPPPSAKRIPESFREAAPGTAWPPR